MSEEAPPPGGGGGADFGGGAAAGNRMQIGRMPVPEMSDRSGLIKFAIKIVIIGMCVMMLANGASLSVPPRNPARVNTAMNTNAVLFQCLPHPPAQACLRFST